MADGFNAPIDDFIGRYDMKVFDLRNKEPRTSPSDHFGRLIIAPALAENISVITSDEIWNRYPVRLVG